MSGPTKAELIEHIDELAADKADLTKRLITSREEAVRANAERDAFKATMREQAKAIENMRQRHNKLAQRLNLLRAQARSAIVETVAIFEADHVSKITEFEYEDAPF